MTDFETDVLIVGAGPTGLTLAAQLHAFGVPFRIVDRAPTTVHESRALAVQARTLEVLAALGLADALVARGNAGVGIELHTGRDAVAAVRFDPAAVPGTRFPYILMVSQAETERVLVEHLAARGVAVERGVVAEGVVPEGDGAACTLRHADGREETARARWVVGCDGAHSRVRERAGIAFEGDAYPQHYLLGDVEVDGLAPHDALHLFPAGNAVALFFPLATPRPWRVIVIPGPSAADRPDATGTRAKQPLTLDELQRGVDGAVGDGGPRLRLRDPAWLTHFRLHHRQAVRYRAGPIFLAGDAAHIHSPVGGQGMNTGIQDAWNLAWKLAMVARGDAAPALLDSYEAERWPVGHTLLRTTDRAFGLITRGTSGGALAAELRKAFVARVAPVLLRSGRLRRAAFRFVSQLGIHYAGSPAVEEGAPPLGAGPGAGRRLPDAPAGLHARAVGPHLTLLLCGPADRWDAAAVDALAAGRQRLVVRHLTPDGDAAALGALGVTDAAQYLVRPDGHVAFRCAGRDLGALARYLDRWHPRRPAPAPPAA